LNYSLIKYTEKHTSKNGLHLEKGGTLGKKGETLKECGTLGQTAPPLEI